MLKKLEAELEVNLFDRTKNKITLNEAGARALYHTKIILEQVEHMKTDMHKFSRKEKVFYAGFCDPAPMWYCAPKFSVLFPNIELKSDTYKSTQDEISLLIKEKVKVTQYTDYFMFRQTVFNNPVATITTRIVRSYRDDGNNRSLIPITDPEASMDYYIAYKTTNKNQLQPLLTWV